MLKKNALLSKGSGAMRRIVKCKEAKNIYSDIQTTANHGSYNEDVVFTNYSLVTPASKIQNVIDMC